MAYQDWVNSQYTVNRDAGGNVTSTYSPGGASSIPASAAQSISSQAAMQQQQAALAAQLAQQKAAEKQAQLRQAWERNQQGLNSQRATVDNNYTSAANKLNSLRDARLPEFQQQRNMASAEAAQLARRNKELMAASGRGDSGYNRSGQLATELNRSNAISAYTRDENQFKTDVGNQLSDVDSQRVAALNDIASKLQLGQQQLNDGTLDINNQLQSEIATGALKASMDAQTWADQKSQQDFDNTFRQKQFDQASQLSQLEQAWREKQFAADQEAQAFNQALQQGQITGTYNGQSTLAAQAQAAEQAYRKAALEAETNYKSASLAASREKAQSKSVTQSSTQGKANQDDAMAEVQNQLSLGESPGNVALRIEQQREQLKRAGINVDTLIKQVWQMSGVMTSGEL